VVGAPPKSVPVITWQDLQFRVMSAQCVGSRHAHPRHRLSPDVWDDAIFIPATGFCLMCGMTQFSPPPQALPDVWDDPMLTPATGCSKWCLPNKARAPVSRRLVSVGTNDPHPGIMYRGAWRCVLPTGPADFILLIPEAAVLHKGQVRVGSHRGLLPASPVG
jgi:hypothetical protein